CGCHPHLCGIPDSESAMESFHATTILSVRKNGKVVLGGDGQVTLGNTVVKANARKIRRLGKNSDVLAGFAGATADAFTLFELFEDKLATHNGQLTRASGTGQGMADRPAAGPARSHAGRGRQGRIAADLRQRR